MKKLTQLEREVLRLSTESHLGTMRIDWLNDSISNSWHAKDRMNKISTSMSPVIQQEINELMFQSLSKYEQVVDLCDGVGYDKEVLLHQTGAYVDYYIRLIPTQDTTSFIYVYLK